MKCILVTGGAGFIGSNLIKKLKENKDFRLISLDNYFTGKKENHIEGVTYVEGNTKDIDALITEIPDTVFHLGEYSRVEQSFDDISKVYEFNKIGTFAVLEFCRKHKAKLIYAGSSTKFGDGGLGRDQSPYAWTKATNTELVINYGEWFNLNYAITYFYNVYGPGEIEEGNYATLIGIFKNRYKNKKNFGVVSPGTQLRNFTHVDDIVSGLILVGDRGVGDNYGLGSDDAYSVLEVAKMFGGQIEMLPPRRGNRMSAIVNTHRTKNELNWQAAKKLPEHIKNYLEEN